MSRRRDRVVLHPVHGPGLAEAVREIPGIELVEAADTDGVVSATADGFIFCVAVQNSLELAPYTRFIKQYDLILGKPAPLELYPMSQAKAKVQELKD